MSDRKCQYGVQIVWADPVAAGATKADEPYDPKWMSFEDIEAADRFADHFKHRLKSDPIFGGVKEINRAERWAVEQYGPWVTRQ